MGEHEFAHRGDDPEDEERGPDHLPQPFFGGQVGKPCRHPGPNRPTGRPDQGGGYGEWPIEPTAPVNAVNTMISIDVPTAL